jgi:hypothetical protein
MGPLRMNVWTLRLTRSERLVTLLAAVGGFYERRCQEETLLLIRSERSSMKGDVKRKHFS